MTENLKQCISELAEIVRTNNPEHVAKAILELGWGYTDLSAESVLNDFKAELSCIINSNY